MNEITKKRVIGIAAIVFVTFLVYMPAISGDWIWDDGSFISGNPIIKASNGLRRYWASTEPPDYFPLTSTTLWLEWRLWGMNTTGYHVTNIILHIISSLLIWLILIRLKIPLAWLCAFIFAIHPVNLEAVAWITQRKTTLPMVFYLLSILLFLKNERTKKNLFYIFSLICFVLALLSKTSIVMLPFVLLGCVWWEKGKITREDIKRVIPFFAAALILGLVTVWFQYNRSIGGDIVRTDSFLSRFAGSGWVVWFYLYKAIFPVNLAFVYPRWEIDPSFIASYLPGALLVGILVVFWWKRKSWGRPFLFALGYFSITLFPFLGFLNIYYMRYSLVADHYQYQSMISIIALVVGVGYYGFNKLREDLKPKAIAVVALLMVFLCFQTWKQAHIYQNVETLFVDTIAKNPTGWMPHYNQGHFYQEHGEDAKAMEYYTKAFILDSEESSPLNNMGNIVLSQGKTDQAIEYFRLAVKVNPDQAESYYNMGVAYQESGRIPEAIEQYYEAIRANPKNEKAHNNLANALATQGRYNQALPHYDKALRLSPNFLDALINKGIILKRQKKYDAALRYFYNALRISPNDTRARNNVNSIMQLRTGQKWAQ